MSNNSSLVKALEEILGMASSVLISSDPSHYVETCTNIIAKCRKALSAQPGEVNEGVKVLKELVRLKDIKDRLDQVEQGKQDQAFVSEYGQYVVDKAKAWKKAREITSQWQSQQSSQPKEQAGIEED